MLVAIDGKGDRRIAWLTEKSEGPFYCPMCKDEVTIRKGQKREHHYAHRPPTNCAYGSHESYAHYRTQRGIYEALSDRPGCTKLELERVLKGVRPDISLYIDRYPVAIEVQKSDIEINEIIKRTNRYTQLGIHLLWLSTEPCPPRHEWDDDEHEYLCRPREWQKFLQAMYFGRWYFWQRGALVSPVHFGKHDHFVERTNWVEDFSEDCGGLEGTDWYQQNVDEAEHGGYWKTHKTIKVANWPEDPNYHDNLYDLVDDFKPDTRQAYSMSGYNIPAAKLWMDSLKKWW